MTQPFESDSGARRRRAAPDAESSEGPPAGPSGPTEPRRRRRKRPSPEETTAEAGPAPRTSARPLPARLAYALAVLTGVLYFLSFPGIDVWPLAFVALVPLIVALRGQPARRALGLGWAAGFTMTMLGFYWLLEMLRVFSGFPVVVCVFFMAVLCGYQSGRIALAGWLYGRAEARGWPAAPVFALAFAASELLYPLLFPWYFGASVHGVPVLMQTAELGGPIVVGLVLVAANLAFAELVLARRERRAPSRALLATGALVPLAALGYGAFRMAAVDRAMAEAKPVKVGIVQPNLPLFDRSRGIPLNVKLTRELKEAGAELVVWSEATITRSFREDRYEEELPALVTRRLGVPTVVGGVLRRPIEQPRARGRRSESFNVALLADETGAIKGRYDKTYLLAFGEYLPFGDLFPILYEWSPNSGQFSRGTSLESMPLGEHRIGALICYEDILPSFVNKLVAQGDPDLLVNLTNDAWFGDSTEPWIHLALSKMRAIEHRRFLVRATNSGVSGIVDANGRLKEHGGTFREEKILGEARYMRARTPYELWGDVPLWLAAAAAFGMAFVRRPGRKG